MVCQSTGRGGHGHAIHGNGERTQAAGGAAGGAHAPANAGRCGGAAGCRGPGQLVACGHRAGQRQLGHPLRPGGNRQNLHRSRHRRIHEGHVRGGVGHRRHRIRPAPGNRRRREALGAQRLAYHPVCGRDPSIQSQSAGCASSCGGEPHRGAGGSHHREPVFRGELRSYQPLACGWSQGALRRRCGTSGRPGRCRPSRAGRLVYARPGCPQRYRALGGRRRPRIAYHPRACGGHAAARHAREPCRYHEGAGGKRYAAPRIAV